MEEQTGPTTAPSLSSCHPRLVSLSTQPFNAETMLSEHRGVITPNAAFYKRNHFRIPKIDASIWRLTIDGEVSRRYALSYAELLSLPSRTLIVTLECAGNGRSSLRPQVAGELWGYGAVSTAEWTGVPLRVALERAGLLAGANEIVIEGADSGYVEDAGASFPFARSLSRERALHPDTLIAYAMNGEPLPAEHGFPARLIVPRAYGMASVKWVLHIRAQSEPFLGYYQVDRYVMVDPNNPDRTQRLPDMSVRALFTGPADASVVPRGTHCIRGLAWSGTAPLTGVEVSVDGGVTWVPATFTSDELRYAWREWEFIWEANEAGTVTVQCRALDALGNTQPATPLWNPLGYGNNAIQSIQVNVR